MSCGVIPTARDVVGGVARREAPLFVVVARLPSALLMIFPVGVTAATRTCGFLLRAETGKRRLILVTAYKDPLPRAPIFFGGGGVTTTNQPRYRTGSKRSMISSAIRIALRTEYGPPDFGSMP